MNINSDLIKNVINVDTSIDNKSRVNFIKGKNLFSGNGIYYNSASYNKITNGIRITPTISSGATFVLFKLIDVSQKVGKKFTIKANFSGTGKYIIGLTDETGNNRISGVTITTSNTAGTYTIPTITTSKYLGVWLYGNAPDSVDYTNIMVNEGDTALPYEAYITPAINVDGEDIYVKGQNEVYSTKEQRIGTWINGKPLYRRVIQATSLTVDGTQIIIASISNMEFCMYLGWLSYTTGGGYTVIMNSYNPDDPTRKLYLWVDTIAGNVKYSLKNVGGNLLTVILEYTKTTD